MPMCIVCDEKHDIMLLYDIKKYFEVLCTHYVDCVKHVVVTLVSEILPYTAIEMAALIIMRNKLTKKLLTQ